MPQIKRLYGRSLTAFVFPFHSLQFLNKLRHTGFWSRPRPIKCHKEHSLTRSHIHQVPRMSLSCFGPLQLNPVSCDSLASHLKLCQRLSKWYVPDTDGKGGRLGPSLIKKISLQILLLLLLTELPAPAPAPTVAHKRLQLQQGRDPIQDNFMNSLSTL